MLFDMNILIVNYHNYLIPNKHVIHACKVVVTNIIVSIMNAEIFQACNVSGCNRGVTLM